MAATAKAGRHDTGFRLRVTSGGSIIRFVSHGFAKVLATVVSSGSFRYAVMVVQYIPSADVVCESRHRRGQGQQSRHYQGHNTFFMVGYLPSSFAPRT